MDSIPVETLINIFRYLPLKDLVKIVSVCHQWKDIIKSTKWNLLVTPKTIRCLAYLLDHFRFYKYSMAWIKREITDDMVLKMKNCTYLDLSGCKQITNKSIKKMCNIETINLSECYKITDNGIKMLSNVKNLYLRNCCYITGKTIPELKKLVKLDLSGCVQLNDERLKYLTNLKSINLTYCNFITENGLQILHHTNVIRNRVICYDSDQKRAIQEAIMHYERKLF